MINLEPQRMTPPKKKTPVKNGIYIYNIPHIIIINCKISPEKKNQSKIRIALYTDIKDLRHSCHWLHCQ